MMEKMFKYIGLNYKMKVKEVEENILKIEVSYVTNTNY